jgi:hypothetical protein
LPCPLIIGDMADLHVSAVFGELSIRDLAPLVLDAESLATTRWRRSINGIEVAVDGRWRSPTRGWLRRLAPAGYHIGMALGSLAAAEATARLALIASLSETDIEWVTDYWSTIRAENKLVQYRLALAEGVPVPTTCVVADPADIDPALGDVIVMKPLGLGEFRDAGEPVAVHARLVERNDPVLTGLHVAPFIAQQRIIARKHLRVVTVGARAWTAQLDARNLPLDWRRSAAAHTSWTPAAIPAVEAMAMVVARSIRARFTSQDWIMDDDGKSWFIDGNPGGQWLFLPDEIADPVTGAIADWLSA